MVGDFGCGEAFIAAAVADRHAVHSFDHVAINDAVVACDIAHVPLATGVLDVAIFCLSLMGANFTDYAREARRCLHHRRMAAHLGGRELLRGREQVLRAARAARLRRDGASDRGSVRAHLRRAEREEARPRARPSVPRSRAVAVALVGRTGVGGDR